MIPSRGLNPTININPLSPVVEKFSPFSESAFDRGRSKSSKLSFDLLIYLDARERILQCFLVIFFEVVADEIYQHLFTCKAAEMMYWYESVLILSIHEHHISKQPDIHL